MQISTKDLWRRWIGTKPAFWPAAMALALAFFAGGCSGTKPQPDPAREPVQMLLPRLTEVVTGPAAGLLTNLDGFHGQFTISFGAPGENQWMTTGELYERDGKLCFEPVFKKSKRKDVDAGAFSLIWDAAAKSGYVLSDGLQGFAPVAAVEAGAGESNNVAGWRVERANHLNGLATRIESLDELRPFTLTLSDIKPGLPSPNLFVAPDGFTRYESEGALLGELLARQRTVMGMGRKQDGELGPYNSEPSLERPRGSAGSGY
ncbi:MAG TPA: hypothetical protein VN048_12305 [Verrucomicrobiae bacterium]|nr:hypothetical protein [Verrucomicrobiae bacterium]